MEEKEGSFKERRPWRQRKLMRKKKPYHLIQLAGDYVGKVKLKITEVNKS